MNLQPYSYLSELKFSGMCLFLRENVTSRYLSSLWILYLDGTDFTYKLVYLFLKDFRHKRPEVTILDPPDAIQHLLNRQSMLQNVAELNLSDCYGNLFTTFNSIY
jgi:hypothetical protein